MSYHSTKKHRVGVSAFKFDELNGMISTDLPGRFPIKSAQGNSYILVMYCYTNNAILAEPIQTRLAVDIEKGYNKLYKKLLLSSIIPLSYNKWTMKQVKNSSVRLMTRTCHTRWPLPEIIAFSPESEPYKHSKINLFQY